MGENIKKMAEILKSGAAMLSEPCPQCHAPLFRMPSGEVYCVNCDRKVIIVKDEEEVVQKGTPASLTSLEETITWKLRELEQKIKAESDVEALQKLVNLTSDYLQVLEKIRKIANRQ